jgi:hypothetical protein
VLGAGTTFVISCSYFGAQSSLPASPVESKPKHSYVWQTWTDHRPIGQLLLAGRGDTTPQNPGKWNLEDVDITTRKGVADFRSRMLAYAETTARNILQIGGQGVIVWDIEGQRYGYLNYVGDPRLLPRLAPEMEPLANQLFEVFRRQGLKVGVCLRADTIALQPDGFPVPKTNQSYYKTEAQALADLDAKLSYAKNRWGCTIFYVDSNGDGGQYIGEKGHAGIYPASIYGELHRRHPDCLICPEEYYNNGERGPNDSYSPVTAPYEELRVSSPAVGGVADYPPGTRDQFPGAFMLLLISDGDIKGKMEKLVRGVRAGNILLFRSWFESHEMDDVAEILKRAKSAYR